MKIRPPRRQNKNLSSSTPDPSARIVPAARILALALIAACALGLAYLRFGSGDEQVSVPAGAQAGQLTLKPCDYDTENGSYPAECGTLVVPENRANPNSRLIALPVTRIRARSPQSNEPVFRLEGGPGLSNMNFPMASRYADNRDVVLVGYRGTDGSSVLNCPEVISARKHSVDLLDEKSLNSDLDAFRACANRLTARGVDLAGYTLPERVDDLEAARQALGYQRIDLISESVGTRTAMIYSWRHPASIARSVMIGVNPPGHFLWNPQTTDQEIRHYAELCAADDACSRRTDDLAASMQRTAADMPDRWGFLPIKDGNVRIAAFFGLMESTSEAGPLSAPFTVDAWLTAAQGDPSGLWVESMMAELLFPNAQIWGDVAAVARADAATSRQHFATRSGSILGDPATQFMWGAGGLVDSWPSNSSDNEYSQVQTSNVETLLISGSVDFSTPAKNATNELLPFLPNGHQVILSELGHTNDFWSYQTPASTHLINTFLTAGNVDDSLYTHRTMNFTPPYRFPTLAKYILGIMIGFAALAVLSLLWMARRVHNRGGFGRKSSAALRSVYPLVLGLGGWFLGALITLRIWPTVPLDDLLLAVVSIGVPIGLGIFFAWVRRDWSGRTKAVGFVAAAGGALVGGWLGYHSSTGIVAVLTTIVGAGVVANLAIICLDIARDRSVRALVGASPSQVFEGANDGQGQRDSQLAHATSD